MRPINQWIYFSFLLSLLVVSCQKKNHRIATSASGISVSVKPEKGEYDIHTRHPNWHFKGAVGDSLTQVGTSTGRDSIGSYHAIHFSWKADNPYEGTIRRYDDEPVVSFLLTVPNKADHVGAAFPSFTSFPDSMYHYSFKNEKFAPPLFALSQSSTPWLFFNQQKQGFILSPASDFMVSKMMGDGDHTIASGLNAKLQDLPPHFTHKTVLAFGNTIHETWKSWGNAIQKMYGRKRPGNESDPILKYYGYWTDNGGHYYYNYDKNKGYAGTLQALKDHYKKNDLPMGYMQLDSWWYEKSKYDPNGKAVAGYKNHDFPNKGKWNRYGGMLQYKADKYIFSKGLKNFHQQMDVPFVVHNRWIDPRSPYHKQYSISGYAAVGPEFWNHIAHFIKSAGVVDYEQDWLNEIYKQSPKMTTNLSLSNAFTDNMAKAMKAQGIDMQYCMAMPRFFMQGVKYSNLTTIRTSEDRFEPAKWRSFLYTSELANSMGIWPWTDVFMSHERGNMIVSVLSAGVVGTGDALGKEDASNIKKAARSDGVLVKPDEPLLPMDSDFIHDAHHEHQPMLASTYTKQNNVRTNYVFAFAPKSVSSKRYSFRPSVFGMKGQVVVYDPITGSLKKMPADSIYTSTFASKPFTENIEKTRTTNGSKSYNYTYYIVAPVTPAGIGFLGDKGKIASTGRQRIAVLSAASKQLKVKVTFADGEPSVQLHGYYDKPFKVDDGKLKLNGKEHTFTLKLSSPEDSNEVTIHFTPK